MIRITHPVLNAEDGYTYLISHISSDAMKIDTDIWYRIEEKYSKFLVNETADMFLLPMLHPALQNHEDINIEAPISEQLYYNITHNLLYTLSIPWKWKCDINIKCSELVAIDFNAVGVGCGCSLGVDSFSAMIRHMGVDCPKGYKITHLTNFNVGAYGNNFDEAHRYMEESLPPVKEYSRLKQLPLVVLESNFGVFFHEVNFNWCGPIRTMGAVLALQKLFKRYYYASGTSNDKFDYTDTMCDMASIVVPLFSTESTELIVADQDKNRIEKTASIVNDPLAQQYLDVCWKKIIADKGNPKYLQYPFKNCTRCSKCMRTLLTIDVLGYTDNFKEIFDVEYFRANKKQLIKEYVSHKEKNHYYKEVYELMVEKGYPIPKDEFKDKFNRVSSAIKRKVMLLFRK